MCAPRATRSCETSTSPATAWVLTPRRTQHTGLAAAGLPRWKIVQEATAVARLASQGGWGKEPPPPTILKSPGAVQGQRRRLPSSPPQAAAPGDELARVGRQLASARELDGLVHRGGDRGLAGGAGRVRPGAGSPGTRPWRS